MLTIEQYNSIQKFVKQGRIYWPGRHSIWKKRNNYNQSRMSMHMAKRWKP